MDRVRRLEEVLAAGGWRAVERRPGSTRGRCARRREAGDERALADRRGAAPARRRSLAFPARPDRLHRRRRRRDGAVAAAIERAWARFRRHARRARRRAAAAAHRSVSAGGAAVQPRGPVARRMVAACRPHAAGGRFITAMAAVAGSVAEELIGAFDDPRIARAYVNNGGDIALHLTPGAVVRGRRLRRSGAAAVAGCRSTAASRSPRRRRCAASPPRAGAGAASRSASPTASRCWRRRAARADAAATVVANAVDVDDPRIVRAPANAVRDDSDLGDRLVDLRACRRCRRRSSTRRWRAALPRRAAEIGAGRIDRRRALAARPLARCRRASAPLPALERRWRRAPKRPSLAFATSATAAVR